jgi:hypothetical protein
MPQGSSHPGQPLTLLWMGLLTGVIMVAGAMYWLPYHAAPGFPGGSLWWLAILLPIAPAWLFRQRAHALEQAWRRDPAKEQEWRAACILSWGMADLPVMLGAPIGMISGQKELILGGLIISVTLLLLSRPDSSRHV